MDTLLTPASAYVLVGESTLLEGAPLQHAPFISSSILENNLQSELENARIMHG